MAIYITVRMTRAQALELLAVAGNGYGDGDYYEGGQRGKAAYFRARAAIRKALAKAEGTP